MNATVPAPIILAIETSGKAGSVALARGERLIAACSLDPDRRAMATLAPALKALLADAGVRPQTLGLVAVTTGPGSFTGLRLGVATAKALAYAAGCGVVGVNTLAAIAEEALRETPHKKRPRRVWPVIDAQRGEFFAACVKAEEDAVARGVVEVDVLSAEALRERVAPDDAVVGPGTLRLARLPSDVSLSPEIAVLDLADPTPQAATVARLALRLLAAGRAESPFTLAPHYFRPSAAEERMR